MRAAEYSEVFPALVRALASSDPSGVELAKALAAVSIGSAQVVADAIDQRDRVQAENSRLVEERRKVEAERDALETIAQDAAAAREWLWVNHGCETWALHRDDSDMLCYACGKDFKHDTLLRLVKLHVPARGAKR